MCRLLGVVSSETTDFRFSLHEAPKSLAVLSAEHADGWGLAVHGRLGWDVHRNPVRAGDCDRFKELAAKARGEILLAHIRKRTVGPIGEENTHPFRRGKYVFAHNGTITAIDSFVASDERRAEIKGDTDSERFFAWLLTHVDAMGDIDRALIHAVDVATKRPDLGAANFLFSNGKALWAFRSGRTLHTLERRPGDPVKVTRHAHETDAELETSWSPRRHGFLVASEQMTGEPWKEVAEGTLLRIDSGPARMTVLRTAR